MTLRNVEECKDLECRYHTVILYKGLSNQRTTWSNGWRSRERGNYDNHLEWSPRIMGFIHSRNVCQKEVITFSILWEECTQEEARLIIREETMGSTKYQALTIQRRSLKRWGIWRTMIKKEYTQKTSKDKYSIVIFMILFWLCICLYLVDVFCIIECLH